MNKVLQSVLVICSAVVLTACSSNNGGGVALTPKPIVPSQGSGSTTQPATDNDTSTAANIGKLINTANNNQQNISTDHIDILTIGDKTYTIDYPNISGNSFTKLDLQDTVSVASGSHVSYVKYGVIRDKKTSNEYVFYQGQQTAANKVPSTGTATYQGLSTLICGGCRYNDKNKYVNGTSQLTVDFGNKSITGSLTHPNTTVNLAATINGNSFTGTKDGFTTTGGFFGPNAEEISGVFTNQSQKISGAFGATKQ